MRSEPLDGSDLVVSTVGLGCNNFGGRIDLRADARGRRRRARRRHHVLRHGRHLRQPRRQRASSSASCSQGRRDRVVIATKFGHDMGDGLERLGASTSRQALRRVARAPADRPHRPLPLPPPRRRHAVRRDARRDGGARRRRAGARDRLLELLGRADRRGRRAGARRTAAPRFVAVQNEYSLLRARGRATTCCRSRSDWASASSRTSRSRAACSPASTAADEPRPQGTRLERARASTTPTFDRVEALDAFARERGHSLLDLAIAALAAQPGGPVRDRRRDEPEQVRANAAAADWQLTADELAELT